MQVPHYFLERKQNSCDWSIEGRGKRCGGPNGNKSLNFLGAESHGLADNRRNTSADVNGRSFTPESDTACQRNRRAKKFSNDRAQRNNPTTNKESGLGLRNAAATSVWEIAKEEVPSD